MNIIVLIGGKLDDNDDDTINLSVIFSRQILRSVFPSLKMTFRIPFSSGGEVDPNHLPVKMI
jgi:hypothetical protein